MAEALQKDIVAGALPGASDHGEGQATFAIYAPAKRSVHVAGTFNRWDFRQDPLEQRNEGYWVRARDLPPGRHEYQFVLDETLFISDPYAQEVSFGGAGAQPRSIIEMGRPVYAWRHEDWIRPALRDLLIYEMHVGDFSPEGTYQGVIDRLDHLQHLGINALEVLPLYEAGNESYWGYTPTHFMAARRSFGTYLDLLRMIDEAHGRGIAVILDIVLNHTSSEHPFMKMYKWEESPWYGEPIGERNQFGLPTLDYTKSPTNAFVRDVQNYWLRVFHVDGFRYDYLAGLGGNDEGQGLPYLMRTAREIRPEAYLIGECIPEKVDLVNRSGLSATWHTRCRGALECLLRERDEMSYRWDDFAATVKTFEPGTQGYDYYAFMVNYLECHDDIRVIKSLRDCGFSEEVAYRKAALGTTLLMTIPGEPMLYHGQEWGETTERTLDENKIHWELLETDKGRWLRDHLANVCRLRREKTSIRAEHFAWLEINAPERTMVYHRWLGEADHVVVAVNCSAEKRTVHIRFPQQGHWRERFSGQLFEITGDLDFEIEGYWAVVFTVGIS